MATNGLNKYIDLIKSLLPQGRAWTIENNLNIRTFVESVAPEFCRIDDTIVDFVEQVFPDTTTDFLIDWERIAGLPDECTAGGETIEERRNQLIQKLTSTGGQNAAFFEETAETLGFPGVEIIDFKDFEVGRSRIGEALTNEPWRFWWRAIAPATLTTVFKVGFGRVGDRLVEQGNETLECTFEKLKPAHTNFDFIFT